jgi:sugar lactone lactonase YvrE
MRFKGLLAFAMTVPVVLLGVCWDGHADGATPKQAEGMMYRAIPLVRGALLHGANGMTFDGQGLLHVASVFGDEILSIDSETGELIGTIGANKQVVGPDEVVFGPDSSLYWTSFATGEVCRVSRDGMRKSQLVGRGVNAITFSDDGRLFVTIDFMGDALYELDPELDEPPRLVAENLGFLNGMDFGPDGYLYGPLWTKGEIVRIDVETGDFVTVAYDFLIPAAAAFDSRGRLCAVDNAAGRVVEIDVVSGAQEILATLRPGLDYLVFDPGDRLFVSNGQDGSVIEVVPGEAPRTVCAGGMIVPGGVAVLPREDGESVFVTDFWSLREYDAATGAEISVECHLIGQPGRIITPFTVSADGDHLILSSWLMRDAVQIYDPWKHEILETHRGFSEPLNAIRFQGDLVVAERGTKSIVRQSTSDPGQRTVLAEGIEVPVGLAAAGDDLWASDWATGRLLQVVKDGVVLPEPLVVADGLVCPEGVAVDLDGSLLVVESEIGKVSRIEPSTGAVTTVVAGLPRCLQADHPTWIFNGVAVGPSGAVFVTSDSENQLLRIEPDR